MHDFITLPLPDGSLIRKANVIAVRCACASKGPQPVDDQPERVIVDFHNCGQPRTVIIHCKDVAERDKIHAEILAKLQET